MVRLLENSCTHSHLIDYYGNPLSTMLNSVFIQVLLVFRMMQKPIKWTSSPKIDAKSGITFEMSIFGHMNDITVWQHLARSHLRPIVKTSTRELKVSLNFSNPLWRTKTSASTIFMAHFACHCGVVQLCAALPQPLEKPRMKESTVIKDCGMSLSTTPISLNISYCSGNW